MSKEELEVNELEVTDLNEEKKVEKKKYDVRSMFLVLIGVICIGIAIYGLYGIYMDYKTADDIYEKATDEFVQITIPEDETEEPKGPWYEIASVDVKGLQSQYPDVVGWILFEDGLISYPVVHAGDNDKYLHTTYDGKDAKAGSIFVEATHSGDFTDTHTIIYGHNMRNLSMFGRLKHYKTKEGYYDNHKYIQIFHGDEILRYQIFSYQEVGVDSFVYQEHFTSAKELSSRLAKRSMIDAGLNIEDDDRIITLSTCTADDEHRFVVSAVLIERYNITKGVLTQEVLMEEVTVEE